MASVLLKSMMASIAGPLLHLSRAALKPRSLSTSLLDALRGAHPPGTEVRWLPWGRAQRSLLQLDPLLPSPQPAQGFKTKGVLKKRCRDCYLVKRRGRWFVYCKTHPRHKQRLM